MYMLFLCSLLFCVITKIESAELIGTAIKLNDKGMTAQLIALAGYGPKARAYKNAVAKWSDIGTEIEKYKKGSAGGGKLEGAAKALADKQQYAQAYLELVVGNDGPGLKVLKELPKLKGKKTEINTVIEGIRAALNPAL